MEPGDSLFFVAVDSLIDGFGGVTGVEWSATGGTVDSAGFYRAPSQPGSYRVIAKGANSADSALVIVTPDVRPSIALAVSSSYWLEISPGSLSLPAGGKAQFTAAFKTSAGNTYTFRQIWKTTGGSITSTGAYTAPTTAGTYFVIVNREGDSMVDTAAVTVAGGGGTTSGTVGTDYKRPGFWIEVLPSTLKLAPLGTQQFTAVGRTVSGNTYSVRVNWRASGGTISSTGYYKAPSTNGTYRVSAQRVGDVQTDTTVVTVGSTTTTPPAAPTLSSVVLTPATVSLAPAAKQQFTAQGKMSDGSSTAVSVTYSATGGSITTAGLVHGGVDGGHLSGDRGAAGGTKADTSAVTVSTGTLSSVVLTPATVSLATGAKQQFTAQGEMSDGSTTA